MGHLDRRGGLISFSKMGITWLSLILGVITLATPALAREPRVVCYYTNWSVYRPGTARFNPQNINPYLCTHLIYAFGGFTKDNTLKPFDKYQDIEKGGYAKFTGLKTYNRNLKTLLAIGGWNEGSSRFSPMVASRERRKEFVRNAIKFLRQNRFDGLDLDWEYPAFRDGGKPKDRENYAKLVKELREEFDREAEKTGKPRLLLTMAVPAGIEYIQKGFDVKTLNQYLDWMNLLTYDYHSAFEPAVNHHAPLYPLEEPNEYSVDTELNIDYTIKFYLENGADPDKLVLGIPTYGRSYTLFNADAVEIGSPADGPGEQGDATREKGYLAYYEICESLKPKTKKKRSTSDEESEEYEEEEDEEWTIMHPNPDAMGPVAFRGNQWVGYDDIDIVKKKGEYVAENGLGGIMFWSIDNDDFRGNCHEKPYPLIEAAKEAYMSKIGSTDNAIASRTSKPASRPSGGNRRRNRPKSSTTTTPQPSAKSNKRKSSVSSTTPSWNITPEPPTTPDPGSDFKCVDEGFFPHPRDCKKYFWCLDSGPSDLGIVAHHFTCPSGLFFNKAADSCDFARNVLCKMPASTTTAATTRAVTSATTTTTTTRKPVRLSTKNSALFRTSTTTTTPEPESEEYEDEVSGDITDEDAEDPRVIKELIDLIKKVGGVEQLEKQLHLSESSASTDGASTTTPTPFNKRLYQKVLERARGKNKFPSNSILQTAQNSRGGPQNQGLEATSNKDRLLKKDRPQYTTINRQRAVASTPEPENSEEDDQSEEAEQQTRARAVESQARDSQTRVGTTTKPLQYVNIRRARPTTTADNADETSSRNALFERSETYLSVSEPNTLDIQSSRKENAPEYVTIRRQRPTTEETTTIQYQEEVEKETALEREISSQPQYTSIVRTRGTTISTSEEPSSSELPFIRPRSTTFAPPEASSPEPTTVLAVQISSLLNSPSSAEEAETTVIQTTEAEPTTTRTTSRPTTTTTTTAAPAPSTTPRRTLLRRRGSTTTTSTPAPLTSTTQVSARNYTFVRRRRPVLNPNEILDSDNDLEVSRKIRSTTPDSREVDGVNSDRETGQAKRFRSRTFQSTQAEDSVAAAAVSRGQFRPKLTSDEVISLTPVEVEPQFVPKQSFSPRTEKRFRGRTTAVDSIVDSEVSAATVETRRPFISSRGRSRFTVSSTTESATASSLPSTEYTPTQRRPTFARFSPRPFGRNTASTSSPLNVEGDNQEATETTQRTPTRLSFGRSRPVSSTATAPALQARRLPFPSRVLTTPQSLVKEIEDDDEPESKIDDISLSESAIEEKEHIEEELESDIEEAPKRRLIVKKFRAPVALEESPTEAVPVDDSGKRRFKIIRRRPATTTEATISAETPPISQAPRIRKVIRKKINRIVEEEPEVIAKSIGSLETFKVTTTLAPTTEAFINYGEKRRASSTSVSTSTSSTTTSTTEQVTESLGEKVTEAAKEEVLRDLLAQEDDVNNSFDEKTESIKTEEVEFKQKEIIVNETKNNMTNSGIEEKEKEDISTIDKTETDLVPEVATETEQKAIDLSETKEETTEEPVATEVVETSAETTTTSTTVLPSPTPRARLPFRSQKRLFTSTTESVPSSSRTFSRKYNPGVYTSPASIPTRAPIAFRPSVANRRPPLFTRRPFTTARTTTRIEQEEEEEPEYSDEELLDEEPENPFVFVPSSQLFTRKPDEDDIEGQDEESEEIFEDGNKNDQNEEEPQKTVPSITRRPFRPRLLNSNTFRTSTSTTELPKRLSALQNRTTVYSRFASNKPINDTKKRVANVPVGYSSPVGALTPKIPALKNKTQELELKSPTTSATITETETTTDDDYLEMTESTSTLSDSTNTENLSTNTVEAETATAEMEISTDDYLEFTEQTTYYPSTQDDTTNARTVYFQNTASNTETTSETSPQTTTNTPVPPVIKTQFDKLFSVSRVVEVSSKLDKHRLNKNNETTLIEEGQVMIEKKPVVDKIGEVSRFSFIKIVEDEIPIYLTKLGHVYPVENLPDNIIRIDEARNARALNYVEPPRENLVASESVNEAYRHIKKLSDIAKEDDKSKSQVEHVTDDDFLSYINVEKSDKVHEEPLYSQWQFVPVAYENEKNKSAKSFEIVTPRPMLTNPSTLSLESLFKTEMPITARKVSDDQSQPFVVYSASVPTQKDDANIVKLEVLKPEGRSILTFAKGQEFNGGSIIDEATVKSPISVSIVPNTESTTTSSTMKPTSATENITTSPLVEMLTTEQSTVTESPAMFTTEEITTTEIVPEETTTVKLSPVELKRAKYGGFPRRPIIKTGNLTRFNVPRIVKKANSTVSENVFQKANKTSSFSPSKSRFSASRSQNVPVDIRKKITSKTPKVFTTEAPRTTTERKPYFKASRPNFRPAFFPRRTTLPPTTGPEES